MIKAIISGAAGRMGRGIINVIADTKGIEICGGIEKKGDRSIGKDIGEIAGIGRCRSEERRVGTELRSRWSPEH